VRKRNLRCGVIVCREAGFSDVEIDAMIAGGAAAEIAEAAKRLNELRDNWLIPPEWIDRVPEVVPEFPDRIVPQPEYAKAIKERSLTNLYNKRAKGDVQWLEDVHRTLDAAVALAYGWDDYTPDMPDEEILRRLLELNLKRAAEGR
jgi:hypothetical protein